MTKDTETLSEKLSSISAHIIELRKDVGVLEKLILIGDDRDPILTRITTMENKYNYIVKELEEVKRKQENIVGAYYKDTKYQGKEKFMQWLKVSLILSPGVVALTMQIIKLFIS